MSHSACTDVRVMRESYGADMRADLYVLGQ